MSQTCPKCQAPRPPAATECPACGLVYAKFDPEKYQALLAKQQRLRAASPPAPDPAFDHAADFSPSVRMIRTPRNDMKAFAASLRSQTLYPTFRAWVSVVFWLGVLFSVVLMVFAALALGENNRLECVACIAAAAVVLVSSMIGREMSLMLADLSDAAVYSAAQQAQRKQ